MITVMTLSSIQPGDHALAARLKRELEGEVLFDPFSRGRYSTDASIYQIEPIGVVVPKSEQDVLRAIEIARHEGVPVLPLAKVDRSDYQHAVVVGYPTGIAALLARADSDLVDALRRKQASMTQLIDALADAGQINPVITQGIVNVEERVITYDAATWHGGSGGPVFGGDGEVIAVNFGIQPGFSGLNYGVPIRFARELLPH